MYPEIKKKSKGQNVKLWQAFLNEHGFNLGEPDGDFGKNTETATKKYQSDHNLEADGCVGENTWKAAIAEGLQMASSGPEIPEANAAAPTGSGLTFAQLKKIMIGAKTSDIETFIEPIKTVMEKYEINTPLRIAHFLAQLGHESGSMRYKQEIASGAAYEGRRDLGNTQTGDGRKFKGHGLIQITGRANHTAYAKYVGDLDLIDNPERLGSEPAHSAGAAAWFWMTKNLNSYADNDDVLTITKRINGGTNGLQDRKDYLVRAKRALGM
ncbi:MAG: peptidoglycan-binding protein [Bacteroidota bacterium]|nr:peptidoglycan-binding protein [Bacteroidota bacterium]